MRAFGVDGERSDGVMVWQAGDAHGQLDAPGGEISRAAGRAGHGHAGRNAGWPPMAQQIATNQVELACVAAPPRAAERLLRRRRPGAGGGAAHAGLHRQREAAVGGAAHDDPGGAALHAAAGGAVQAAARLLLLAGEPGDGEEPMRLPVGAVIAARRHAVAGRLGHGLLVDQETGAVCHAAGRSAAGDGVCAGDAGFHPGGAAGVGLPHAQLGMLWQGARM